MSDLLGRIKRLERKILPRYRACFNRWQRLLAKSKKARALQQRDPSTWNGDEQYFMTHWQFFLDTHPKLALRLHNLPPAQDHSPNPAHAAHSAAPAKTEGESNQQKRQEERGKRRGADQSKIQNPKSKIDAEEKEHPALNRSNSVTSAHPAQTLPLPSELASGSGKGAGGLGSRIAFAVSRGAKEVPSIRLNIGADRPIHSNVVLPNLDDD